MTDFWKVWPNIWKRSLMVKISCSCLVQLCVLWTVHSTKCTYVSLAKCYMTRWLQVFQIHNNINMQTLDFLMILLFIITTFCTLCAWLLWQSLMSNVSCTKFSIYVNRNWSKRERVVSEICSMYIIDGDSHNSWNWEETIQPKNILSNYDIMWFSNI